MISSSSDPTEDEDDAFLRPQGYVATFDDPECDLPSGWEDEVQADMGELPLDAPAEVSLGEFEGDGERAGVQLSAQRDILGYGRSGWQGISVVKLFLS